MTIDMTQQFAADFGAGIGTDRTGDIMLLRPRNVRVDTIDRRGRGEDELLDVVFLRKFQ